jgi:hypothetical protein
MTTLKDNPVLQKMLDRLFAALVNGPSLNARPHSSRQRIDMTQLARLKDGPLEQILRDLLDEQHEARIVGRVEPPKKRPPKVNGAEVQPDVDPEQKAAEQAYADQQAVLNKCRGIAEDARTYENDTGVHVLQIGFPVLSLPPGSLGVRGFSRRVLAPICFISLAMRVKGAPNPAITLTCRNGGADLVVPNVALLEWLEARAGRPASDIDADPTGARPWDELAQVVERVAHMLNMEVPEEFATGERMAGSLSLRPCPRADEEDISTRIISSAVVGLFPAANQGLIRDTQAMLAGEAVAGPVHSFVSMSADLATTSELASDVEPQTLEKRVRAFDQERLIADADPCQARAVRLARHSRGLVIHGPPGTGKSQTIANIIGDHLARGERVLFVCDKRTALDVVMNRLDSMGFGSLCAIVHDPQRDPRELYKAIRQQLDDLTDLQTDKGIERRLNRLDQELQKLHDRLTEHHQALMLPPGADTPSFHELMGRWMALPDHAVDFPAELLEGVSSVQLESLSQPLHELLERGTASHYPGNPWAAAAGIPLSDFLAAPMDEIRGRLQKAADLAAALDQTADEAIPPFQSDEEIIEAGRARADFAPTLERLTARNLPLLHRWLQEPATQVEQYARQFDSLRAQLELAASGPLDTELNAVHAGSKPPLATINQQIVSLERYLSATRSFLGFIAFGRKKAARLVLSVYGLSVGQENATRVRAFLTGLKARILLQDAVCQWTRGAAPPPHSPDAELIRIVQEHGELFTAIQELGTNPYLVPLKEKLTAAAAAAPTMLKVVQGLLASPARAGAIEHLEQLLPEMKLFDSNWTDAADLLARKGDLLARQFTALQDSLPTLENVLRIRQALSELPRAIARAAETLLEKEIGSDTGLAVLRKAALHLEISSRLRNDARLQSVDTQNLQSVFDRYVALGQQKKQAVRELVLHLWGSRQKERLLAGTQSRLNSAGADLRRRFVLRGERAMRLRQVIAVGQNLPEGDPLFDLRPVWMASPETVAQVFPRRPLFDVIVFDEASQCRLEEALPVLLRGQRVVIAGDPKQLPPTRFFESAVAISDQDDIETDQQLFEAQQGEIEDLLGAALNIEIDECYLDVHYRSNDAALIEFSNTHFYNGRLQPIPGHPANRSRFAPLTLYTAGGVYQDRQNEIEATRVCQIVRDLLRRAEPPSIGIATFNINQRDLVLEKLEELSEADAAFGRALDQARTRRRNGQFEGLFVKNLENVQGDERDHIIISTTYGPDPRGRFYRRFGPLGRAGGGRRLNVLVTRARQEVHLVSSIPPSEYRSLPPIPPGQAPGGPWLLFSYLQYAEQLADIYEAAHLHLENIQRQPEAEFVERVSRYPSSFCRGLGCRLVEQHNVGADVFWGNDGFCVDLALHHPQRAEDVTIGVLCDANRFGLAADPVEWEVFRTLVLESQGWELQRLWTPHFFRDPRGVIDAILRAANELLSSETDPDALRVRRSEEEPS